MLIEIIRRRLLQHQRAELVSEVDAARESYQQGDVGRGDVEDLIKELGT